MTQELHIVQVRLAEIEQERKRLQDHLRTLDAEQKELEIAERVFARLTGAQRVAAGSADEQPAKAHATTKPEGTPSVPEMIMILLWEAREAGAAGLEPKEMTARIAEAWWPDVRGDAVSPIAWRMWKRGQLEKDGSIYKLPETKEAPPGRIRDGASSQVTGEVAASPVDAHDDVEDVV